MTKPDDLLGRELDNVRAIIGFDQAQVQGFIHVEPRLVADQARLVLFELPSIEPSARAASLAQIAELRDEIRRDPRKVTLRLPPVAVLYGTDTRPAPSVVDGLHRILALAEEGIELFPAVVVARSPSHAAHVAEATHA